MITKRKREEKMEYEDDYAGVDDVDGAAAEGGAEEEVLGERTALLGNGDASVKGKKGRPLPVSNGTQRSRASQRQLSMLYAATPPEHDSDRSSSGR